MILLKVKCMAARRMANTYAYSYLTVNFNGYNSTNSFHRFNFCNIESIDNRREIFLLCYSTSIIEKDKYMIRTTMNAEKIV